MLRDISMNTDPGQYNPTSGSNMAATSARPFYSKRNASGEGSFGSTSGRKMRCDIMGEESPCPTTYGDEQLRGLVDGMSKMRSATFNSGSNQRPRPLNLDTKNAFGNYDPNYAAVLPKGPEASATMRSKSPRFQRAGLNWNDSSTDNLIGPGKYNPDFKTGGVP